MLANRVKGLRRDADQWRVDTRHGEIVAPTVVIPVRVGGVFVAIAALYLVGALDGSLLELAQAGPGEFFAAFVSDPVEPLVWQGTMGMAV